MANIESLALKYRPHKLSEVIGQPTVVTAFTNAFKSKSLHKAYILAGNLGCGKTSVARIVAAMENCEEGWGKDPCGKCANCKEILAGESLEVLEFDAATKGTVDNIRELHKSLYQYPVKCRTKIVIIDEAHRLTGAAAEASLKMFEEPPKFVRFIMCTTEPQAFKDTITSRCITWNFVRVQWIELLEHLKKVATTEGIQFEEAGLKICARSAKGSVRNALTNLMTVINYNGGQKVVADDVRQALSVVDEVLYFQFIEGVIECNVVKCFKIINKIFADGKPAKVVMDGIFEHLNNLLITRTCKDDLADFDFSEDEVKRYLSQTKKLSGNVLLKMMTLLHQVAFGIEYSLDPDKLMNKFAIEAIMSQKETLKAT
jgi:DNA polymerase-3 subunit gamma/tau